MRKLVPAALIALVATVPSTARDRNEIPVATETGPAQDCVSLARLRDSHVRNDRVIDFMTGNRRGYRVTLDQACPGLGFERAFTYSTSLSQLCRQDIITVLRNAGGLERGASCGLSAFQPIELAPGR